MYRVETIGGLTPPAPVASTQSTLDVGAVIAISAAGIVAGVLGLWLYQRSSRRR